MTREGVTCDFCHTVADVDLAKRGHPFRLEPGPVKRGPLEFAKSPAHETAYSALHRTSPLLCAACHQYTNAQGVEVLSTYSEWKPSPYPERGETCQECHMPLVPGWSVAEGLDASRRRINLHRVEGGGSAGRLATGIDLRFQTRSSSGSPGRSRGGGGQPRRGSCGPGRPLEQEPRPERGRRHRLGRSPPSRATASIAASSGTTGAATSSTVADLFLKARSVGKDTRLGAAGDPRRALHHPPPGRLGGHRGSPRVPGRSGAEARVTPVREVRWERR